ncbi:MAG: DUF4198 domain-containing protein [Bdellovibrionaceae bacterium]|nr:DUF4198 domain-containing protein [Pseudobdellovibrionaceae bacterium]
MVFCRAILPSLALVLTVPTVTARESFFYLPEMLKISTKATGHRIEKNIEEKEQETTGVDFAIKGGLSETNHEVEAPRRKIELASAQKVGDRVIIQDRVSADHQRPQENKGPVEIQQIKSTYSVSPSGERAWVLSEEQGKRPKHFIVGELQMSGGLGYHQGFQFDVKRVVKGLPAESGEVNIANASYSIQVSDLDGILVARLRDDRGKVLGQASYRLSEAWNNGVVKGKTLTLRPVSGISGSLGVFGFDPTGSDLGELHQDLSSIANSTEPNFGHLQDAFRMGSEKIIRLEKEGFHPMSQVARVGDEGGFQLLPRKMVAMMAEILQDQRRANFINTEAALVIGRVLIDGKPVAGAQVVDSLSPEIEVFYFNELFIPEASLRQTSSNGLFVIFNHPGGEVALEAYRSEKLIGVANAILESGRATVANIQSSIKTRDIQRKCRNPFTGELVPCSLAIQGIGDIESISGLVEIKVPDLSGKRWVFVDGGEDSIPTKSAIFDQDEGEDLVVLPRERILNILEQDGLRVEDLLFGAFVGFVGNGAKEVYLLSRGEPIQARISWFDSQGNLSHPAGAGGGFILTGLDAGEYEILVEYEDGSFSSFLAGISPGTPVTHRFY